jgi:hypothetical protein
VSGNITQGNLGLAKTTALVRPVGENTGHPVPEEKSEDEFTDIV